MPTPSASRARAVERLSPPSPRPWISTMPSQSAPKSNARWETDLSPGTRHVPASGPERRARSTGSASDEASEEDPGGVDFSDIRPGLLSRLPALPRDRLQEQQHALGERLALVLGDAQAPVNARGL